MEDFAQKISEQIKALEKENERNERDSKFYLRLLVQLAMANGGNISFDVSLGTAAVEYKGGYEIDSTGFT